MQVGVERLPDRLDGGHALALEDGAQLSLHEPDPIDPALVGILRNARQRAVEVVEHREQLADEHRVRQLRHHPALLLGAPAVVGEVGRGTLPGARVLLVLRSERLQLLLELGDALQELAATWGVDRFDPLFAAGQRPRASRPPVGGMVSHGSPRTGS